MKENKIQWDNIYGNGGSYMEYPNEALVVSYHRIKNILPKEITCLDYGFGSGNNSEFLIKRVNNLYGIEISNEAQKTTINRLKNYANFNENNLKISENKFIPEFENKFDLIVAWYVISYNTHESVQEIISHFFRYLKKGGVLITTLATSKDISKLASEKVSENTYRINKNIADQEGCIVVIPKNELDFKSYFSKYQSLDVGYEERISLEHNDFHSHYYGIFKKA